MARESQSARQRAEAFLKIAPEFHLGSLLTEASHPRTADLSEVTRRSTEAGLRELLGVDRDVVHAYHAWSQTSQPASMAGAARQALRNGGRIFFTGCGATGRLSIQLDAMWRAFWQNRRGRGLATPPPDLWEDRTRSTMAGGDYALIKSVEGFEDFAPFGRKQVADLGVTDGDTLFAITEGGETSFVIGTAWQAVENGAQVFFLYNNPDDVLRASVRRSREVLDDPRIVKINLTTGPMAITGSTRMQATSIELLAMLTVLEMVLRRLLGPAATADEGIGSCDDVAAEMRSALDKLHASLAGPTVIGPLGRLVETEEKIYRAGGRTSYFADSLGIDVLTDTTERSPTFGTPPFRKCEDTEAAESWAFLFTGAETTEAAWRGLLHRAPRTIDWNEQDLRSLLGEEAASRQTAAVREIGFAELMRFRIGQDGLACRPFRAGDAAIVVAAAADLPLLAAHDSPFARRLGAARSAGAETALVAIGRPDELDRLASSDGGRLADQLVALPLPGPRFLLDPMARTGVKMLLNALSTCTMVRLGRVLGNRMIWVVPSNLKLVDRSIRYVRDLTGASYERACHALFDAIDYVEPRRSARQAYPAPVGLAAMRLRHSIDFELAERRLSEELSLEEEPEPGVPESKT